MHRTLTRTMTAGLLAAGIAAGCSGGEPAAADLADYCDATVEVDLAFGALGEPDQDAVAALRPQLERVVALAPEELAEAAEVFQDAFDRAADDGDFSGFETPELAEADATAHAFDLANCGLEAIDVTAADYRYTADLPSAPGRYSFEVTNEGDEPYLAVVARLHDGETGTAEEVFAEIGAIEDPEQAEATFDERFDQVAATFVEPGGGDYQLYDLEAGQYILFCPLPVGGFDGDGPPHFVEGMLDFFEIG